MNQGMICYCDGGSRAPHARGGPGWGGFGIHGYLYRTVEELKKGAGIPDWIPTSDGYLKKKNVATVEHTEVEVIHYIDGVGSFGIDITNNYAELQAAINALRHAQQYVITRILIVSDSRYVIDGMTNYVDNWASYGWKKRNGEEIANLSLWKELVDLRDGLRQHGVTIDWRWVKGHDEENGNIGNDIADRYATIGVMASKGSSVKIEIDTTEAQGYWKNDVDKHPLLCHKRLYFNTGEGVNTPGQYYIGEHGSDDELLGKRKSDGCYGIVRLKNPEPVVEVVINHAVSAANTLDNIMAVRLDNLFRVDTYQDIRKHGRFAFIQPSSYNLSTTSIDEQPLTSEFTRPMLAIRAVESIDSLANKLEMYLSRDPSITTTDLTELFYNKETKVKKKVEVIETVLKPEYIVGFTDVKVDVNFNDGVNGLRQSSVILVLGLDLPHRNSLKQLETFDPKVTLIAWSEEANTFKYATVIEAGEDLGIYEGRYSNLRIVATEPTQSAT